MALDVVDGVDLVEEGSDPRLHVGVRDADELGLVARDVDVAAVGDPRDDELRHAPQQLLVVERLAQLPRRLEEEREPFARVVESLLGIRPLDDGCKVVRDRPREKHLAIAPVVRLVAVEHELPAQPPPAHERDERERPDSLLAHHAFERRREVRTGDVVDEHGQRILDVCRPGRVPLGEGAIAIGKAAPRAESQHALVVGEQDRGTL